MYILEASRRRYIWVSWVTRNERPENQVSFVPGSLFLGLVFSLSLSLGLLSPCPFLQVPPATLPLYHLPHPPYAIGCYHLPHCPSVMAVLCFVLPPSLPPSSWELCGDASVCLSLIVWSICALIIWSSLCSFRTCRHLRVCLTIFVWGAVCVRKHSCVFCVSDSPPLPVGMCLLSVCQAVSQECIRSVLLLLSSVCRLATCSSEYNAPNWFL